MGDGYRSRSRSYSPRRRVAVSRSPPPHHRKHYDEPRRRVTGGGGRDSGDRRSGPTGLLIRNISLDARPEDLRIPFERFGPVRDVYLPRNYYTGEPRGFGFVKFQKAEDAAEAKHQMNHRVIGGREIAIVFADENRKTPQEMRSSGRSSGRYGGGRRSPRSPRRRYHSHSRSPSPRHNSRKHNGSTHRHYSPPPLSRSPSPGIDRGYKSDQRSPSPKGRGGSPSRSRSFSPR